jgi:hypothetical protein
MPRSTSCPVPEVDRALSPYIHPSQETLKIRTALSNYLTANVKTAKSTTPQHLDSVCPRDYSGVKPNPPGLQRTRLNYLRALEARLQAQERHRELQSSVEALQNSHYSDIPAHNDSSYDHEATRGYVSLLRQRRRFSELEVIQDSLEKLLNANPVTILKDPKTRVTETVGEQTDLPVERLDQLSRDDNNDTSMFKLKKEVLEAKASMNKAKLAKADVVGKRPENFTLEQHVYALGCARDEIVAWVEGELAKMNEDSILLEDASPVKQWPRDTVEVDSTSSEQRIRDCYDRYTASRSKLIESHNAIQRQVRATEDRTRSHTNGLPAGESAEAPPTRTITNLMPHIPHLIQTAGSERSLLQHAVYLQSQLSSAHEEIIESITRLSEESHLLPSGLKQLSDWSVTAVEAEKATADFVSEQIQESHHEINRINAIVDLCSLQSKVLTSV